MDKSQSYPNFLQNTLLSPKYVLETQFVQRPSSRKTKAKTMQTQLLQSMVALDLNKESNKIHKEIAECAHLCLDYIQTNQPTKIIKLLNIFLDIGGRRIKRKNPSPQSLKSTKRTIASPHDSYQPLTTIIDEFFKEDFNISQPLSIQTQSRRLKRILSSPINPTFSNSHFGFGQSRTNTSQIETRQDLRKCILNYPLVHNNSLLHEAIKLKLPDIMIELICAGSNIHHRNGIGHSPLLQALHIKDNMKCIIILLAAGCNLSPIDLEKVRELRHVGHTLLALLKCAVVDMDQNKDSQAKTVKKSRLKRAHTTMNGLLQSKQNLNDTTAKSANERVSVPDLLGKIGYKRIDNIRARNLRERLLKAVQVANKFYNINPSDGVDEWERLFDQFEIGKHDYHQKKLKLRAAVRTQESIEFLDNDGHDDSKSNSADTEFKTLIEPADYVLMGGKDFDSMLNTKSFDRDEGEFSKDEREVSKQLGIIRVFPRLSLTEMYDIPTVPRFEQGFGNERDHKGVKIISNTFNRLDYINNLEDK